MESTSNTNNNNGHSSITYNQRFVNSDQTIGLVIDELAQLTLQNRPKSGYCVGINEVIRYQIPENISANVTNLNNETPSGALSIEDSPSIHQEDANVNINHLI